MGEVKSPFPLIVQYRFEDFQGKEGEEIKIAHFPLRATLFWMQLSQLFWFDLSFLCNFGPC